MARPKEFDPDAVLDRALALFWERGYEATSVADLVERLGVGRASLYATFGDKHALYLRALDRYVATRDLGPIALLSQPGPAIDAVRAVVRSYADLAASDRRRRGCFVVNTATERLPGDRAAARRVESRWDALEAALTEALRRAQAEGDLPPERDPRRTARFLLVLLQGIQVLARSGSSAARVRDAAEEALAALG